jgi:hypothetical protein
VVRMIEEKIKEITRLGAVLKDYGHISICPYSTEADPTLRYYVTFGEYREWDNHRFLSKNRIDPTDIESCLDELIKFMEDDIQSKALAAYKVYDSYSSAIK